MDIANLFPDILRKGNCSGLILRNPFPKCVQFSKYARKYVFDSHKGEKILYDQLNIGNMTTLLPINDDVGNGGTHRGK